MNGIINVLKPPGMTSFDVVAYLRGIFKTKKIGHAGTLDPAAVGVLPVCVGNATKAVEYLMDKDKLYRAELTLGVTTDTQDSTGVISGTYDINVSAEQIEAAVKSFTGKISQIPPMYSAIRVDGRKLYELAREGITIERKAREVEIFSAGIIDIKTSFIETGTLQERVKILKVLFDVHCSKGTYIRTLCADIGEFLGCGGHMSFLVRLKAGSFDINSAVTMEELAQCALRNRLGEILSGVDKAFEGFDNIVIDHSQYKKLMNGLYIELPDKKYKSGEALKIYDTENNFLAIGEVHLKHDAVLLKAKKRF